MYMHTCTCVYTWYVYIHVQYALHAVMCMYMYKCSLLVAVLAEVMARALGECTLLRKLYIHFSTSFDKNVSCRCTDRYTPTVCRTI